ncbi:MAG: hypothetical protein ACTSV8_02960 [Candidatus Thorarchaeota archaeon]
METLGPESDLERMAGSRSERNRELLQEIRELRIGSNIMLIVTFLLFSLFVIHPYLVEDLMRGTRGYYVSIGDIYFVEQVFGYYDYALFLFVAVLALSGGLVMGASLVMILRRASVRLKDLKSEEDSILHWEMETIGPLGVAVTIIATYFVIGVLSWGSISADGLELSLNSGLVLDAMTYTYYTMRTILKRSGNLLGEAS